MKVLHLLSSSHFSGAENVVCQIISMFKDQESIEMAYCSVDGQIKESLNERDIKFLPLKSFSYREIRKVIKIYNPDIIHAHDVSASIMAGVVSNRTKVISHMHVNHERMSKFNFKTILYLLSSIRYSHIFWVSNSAFNNYLFRANVASKSSILYNVINRRELLQRMSNDVTNYNYDIVYVGRLTYQKNPEKLIQVMNAVYKKYPFLKCAIIGDGDLLNSIKELIYKSGVDCYIDFWGFRDNPLKIIHDSKLLLMTSRFEGTPMCILEAMAIGTPVVSTPTDGICDLVDNEINGSLAESVEDLAEKSFELITNSNKRDQYSKASIAKFNQLINIDRYVCEIKESYLN